MQKIMAEESKQILLKQLKENGDYNNRTEFTYTIIDETDVIVNYSKSIDTKISNILKEVGVSPSLKGYRYIITAVKEVLRDENVLEGVTKILYPCIARIHRSTSQRVEKAIRYAIEVAWSRNEASRLKNEFKYVIYEGKTRPTNSEFIAILSQYIKMI